MNKELPKLKKGDLIYITAPAKAIDESSVLFAKTIFESEGFQVEISAHCLGNFNYFSGSDAERASDFQKALDNPQVKAIVCARGGYGCIRILDRIEWASFLQNPKWIVGFSDVTVLHQRILNYGLKSIHGTMPLNFSTNTKASLQSLFQSLKGEDFSIEAPYLKSNRLGKTTGKLVGGNLSILYSLLGTDEQIDYTDTILFIEDLAEHLYHMDRMFYAFAKAGVFNKIKGLIVGGMTNLKDTEVPFGQSFEEILLAHFPYSKIPIAFGFPAGHQDDNRALILGAETTLLVDEENSKLVFQPSGH
jgi:muramoyltetrapeptide carboxypeptidase